MLGLGTGERANEPGYRPSLRSPATQAAAHIGDMVDQ
jgi:hypothetical protein